MKKRFLIALFVLLVACLFTFSVSAANEVTLTDGTKVDFTTVFKVNSSNQVTGFNDGYNKNSASDIIFPDEIEGIECNVMFNGATELKTLTFAATDTFFISGDAIFTNCSVEKITFNPDCVVEIRKGNFSGCTSLTQITFPKFKKLAGSSFKDCTKMVATNELVLEEGMTEIGGHAFNGCTSLTGTVYFPTSLEEIQEYSFQNTGFTGFDLSKCAKLTAVGGGFGGPFTDNDSITSLDLSGCTSLKDLKGNFAANCDNLEEVILPPNLENIPSKAFAHCYKMQSIVFPASLKTVADEAFHSARSGQTVKTFTVYIQSNVKMGESYPFRDSGAKIEYVLIGDGITAESFIAANTFTGVTGATVVDYLDPNSKWSYTPGQTINSHTIVKNYCKYLGLTKSHSATDEICGNDDYCKDCAYNTLASHEGEATISYPNGYCASGEKRSCALAICGASKPTEIEPIFVTRGYSIKEAGGYGITAAYKINITELEEYEKVNGALTIGIIMANADFGEETAFMSKNDEGKYVLNTTRGIQVDITENNYSDISVKIDNFTQNEASLNLVMALYVVDENGISYIQHNGTYAGTVTKGDATLDIVTITKIAEIVNVTLPFVVPVQTAEIKENV